MKILYILPYVPSPIRVRPYNFIKSLSKRNEVAVLSLVTGEEELKDAQNLRNLCSEIELIPQDRIRSYLNCIKALPTSTPLSVAYCHSPRLIMKSREMCKRLKPDVIHVEFIRAAYVADHLPVNIPRIIDGVDSRVGYLKQIIKINPNPWSKILSFEELYKMKRYEPKIYSKYDKVIMISEKDRAATEKLNPNLKVEVISNGIDTEYFKPLEIEREPETIVFSGKMSYYPNAEAVLYFYKEILPLIRKKRPRCKFVIVGKNPPKKVRALNADPSITVTDYVEDIRPYLAKVTVAVVPLRIGVGVQNKILEAMAMETPVVATPLAHGNLDAISGNDLLIADTPNKFAENVLTFFKNKDFANKIGKSGREYIDEHHSWEKETKKLEKVYKETLQ
ncbi:MAG TPA: glycosyltransferase [Actinobacteria bacterium]|nr:glycosyltransferase [Actinomycetota bacterium]